MPDETQAVKNLSLEHDFNFKSAYDTNIFTNYTRDFKGCLDYIFYEPETLKTVQVDGIFFFLWAGNYS